MLDSLNGGGSVHIWYLMSPTPSQVPLLLSWDSVESFGSKFVQPCVFICASCLKDTVSVWSQDFYICIQLFVQMLMVPDLCRSTIFFLKSLLSYLDFPMVGNKALLLKVGS